MLKLTFLFLIKIAMQLVYFLVRHRRTPSAFRPDQATVRNAVRI